MVRSTREPVPLSPEAREMLQAAIRSSPAPLTARDIAKQLAGVHRVREADLAPLLEEEIAAGRLFAVPAKSAKGKPRYWDRDVRALVSAALLSALEQAESPLAAKEILRQVPAAIRPSDGEMTALLEQQAMSGRLHVFPASTAKGKPRYWTHGVLEYARKALRKLLEQKGPQAQASLRKGLRELTDGQFRETMDAAIAAGEVWRHPAVGKVKKEFLASRPPSPEPYLRDTGRQLSEIVDRLREANVPEVELRRALVQLVEATGISFASPPSRDSETNGPGAAAKIDLVGLIRRIEPGADRGALVGARDLRRAARLEKGAFDRAVLELARQGGVSLHRHDFATSLTPAERDELVSDGEGTYYVGVALRQSG